MNNKLNSAIAKTLASSVLLSSCSPDASLLQSLKEQKSVQDKELDESKGVAISLSLNEETREKLNQMEPLVGEILQDSISAKEFAESPEEFCQKRGYELMFNENDSILQMLKALGNVEIRKALEVNDFETYFSLCAKMGIFNSQQTVQLNSIFKTKEDREIFEAISRDLGLNAKTRSVAAYIVVSVVVVIAIAITLTFGIDSIRSVKDEVHPVNDSINNGDLAILKLNNPEYMVINLWALQHDVDMYQVVSEYKNIFVDQILTQLKKQESQALTKYSENQVSEFLKINLVV